MNKEQKSHADHLQNVHALNKKIEALRAERRDNARRPPNVPAIVLLMSAVWGLYGLDQYQRHHPFLWYPLLVSLCFSVAISAFLIYCLIKSRIYSGRAPIHGMWIYRDKDPFFYWTYFALYLIGNGALIYELVSLLLKK